MSLSSRRMRSIGWLALLAVCATMVLVLTLRVNALRSQVRREENRIIALREETMYLQTEFETRASQQQLKAWNDVEFGYVAPAAGQYLENERQLAMLGKPAGPDAPAPVRLASADDGVSEQATPGFPAPGFPTMVSPLTGKPMGGAVRTDAVARNLADHVTPAVASDTDRVPVDHAAAAAALGERLGHFDAGEGHQAKPAKKKVDKAGKPRAGDAKAKAKGEKAKHAKAGPRAAAKPKAATNASRHKPAKHASEKPA